MLRRKLFVKSLMAPALLAVAGVSACTVQRMQPVAASQGAVLDDHLAHMTPDELRGPMASPEAAIDMAQQGHAGLPASASTAAARIAATPRHADRTSVV